MRPVDRRIAGSRGKGKGEPYWQKMYDLLGVRNRPFVHTTVGQSEIRAYWNSGLVGARRSAGLFTAWEDALTKLFDAGVVAKRWPHFMDQLSLAAVTADVHDRVRILPDAYNYPLRHRAALVPAAVGLDLADIVHLHYRLWFHMRDSLSKINPPFDPGSESSGGSPSGCRSRPRSPTTPRPSCSSSPAAEFLDDRGVARVELVGGQQRRSHRGRSPSSAAIRAASRCSR